MGFSFVLASVCPTLLRPWACARTPPAISRSTLNPLLAFPKTAMAPSTRSGKTPSLDLPVSAALMARVRMSGWLIFSFLLLSVRLAASSADGAFLPLDRRRARRKLKAPAQPRDSPAGRSARGQRFRCGGRRRPDGVHSLADERGQPNFSLVKTAFFKLQCTSCDRYFATTTAKQKHHSEALLQRPFVRRCIQGEPARTSFASLLYTPTCTLVSRPRGRPAGRGLLMPHLSFLRTKCQLFPGLPHEDAQDPLAMAFGPPRHLNGVRAFSAYSWKRPVPGQIHHAWSSGQEGPT